MRDADDSLLRAMDIIAARLEKLVASTNAVECVAEGKLQVALEAVESAANLLNEGRRPLADLRDEDLP